MGVGVGVGVGVGRWVDRGRGSGATEAAGQEGERKNGSRPSVLLSLESGRAGDSKRGMGR
eukprot:359902-Chlamydomonas_euryale.AAC.1